MLANSDYPMLVNDAFATMWPAFLCSALISLLLAVKLIVLVFLKDMQKETLATTCQLAIFCILLMFFFFKGPYNIVGIIQ